MTFGSLNSIFLSHNSEILIKTIPCLSNTKSALCLFYLTILYYKCDRLASLQKAVFATFL